MITIDSLRKLADVVAAHRHTYLRHSRGPQADRREASRDYGLELPGLSTVPLAPPTWWTRPIQVTIYVSATPRVACVA